MRRTDHRNIQSLYVHHTEKEQGIILLIDLIMGKKNKVIFFLCCLFGCHEMPKNFAFAQDDKRHTQRVGYEQKCPYWHLYY